MPTSGIILCSILRINLTVNYRATLTHNTVQHSHTIQSNTHTQYRATLTHNTEQHSHTIQSNTHTQYRATLTHNTQQHSHTIQSNTHTQYDVLNGGKRTLNVERQQSYKSLPKSKAFRSIVLADIIKTLSFPDMKKSETCSTTSSTSHEPSVHTLLQRNLCDLHTVWTKILIYLIICLHCI